jgi:hypothetical protein
LAVHEVCDAGDRYLEGVHRLRHVAAVEIAAAVHVAAVGVEQGVVVGGVDLDLDPPRHPLQRVAQHAHDVRRAPDRVPVLHLPLQLDEAPLPQTVGR